MKDDMRPAGVSCWNWYDKQHYADLDLWQNCLLAMHNAGAKDVLAAAQKHYLALGGKLNPYKAPRAKGKRAVVVSIARGKK